MSLNDRCTAEGYIPTSNKACPLNVDTTSLVISSAKFYRNSCFNNSITLGSLVSHGTAKTRISLRNAQPDTSPRCLRIAKRIVFVVPSLTLIVNTCVIIDRQLSRSLIALQKSFASVT